MNLLNKKKSDVSLSFSKQKKGSEFEFHKWKKQLIIADELISVIVIILLGFLRPDALVIGVYLLLWPYLILTARKSAFYHLLVSSIISIIWMSIANSQYGYKIKIVTVFGMSSFPLFSWALSLFATYMIYSHWEHKFKFSNPVKRMLFFIAFYWPILIGVETIAYHIFDIKNLTTAIYTGLPICNCIHAPLWMQISYLTLGPLYFIICELIGLENPHHIKKTK